MSVQAIDWSGSGTATNDQIASWSADLMWWAHLANELSNAGWKARLYEPNPGRWSVIVSQTPLQLRIEPDLYRCQLWNTLHTAGADSLLSLGLAPVCGIRGDDGAPCPQRAAKRLIDQHLKALKSLAAPIQFRPPGRGRRS